MKKNKTQRVLALICLVSMMFTMAVSVNATTFENTPIEIQTQSHIQLDALDGYESHEINPKGRVGYNIALPLPNGEVVKLGFDPRNTLQGAGNDVYSIADGWQFKLPYFSESKYYKANGYIFDLATDTATKTISISNYPTAHNISYNKDSLAEKHVDVCIEEAYGVKEYYKDNSITKAIDTFGKTTNYIYEDNRLSQIVYSNGATVSITSNTKNNIEMTYTEGGVSTTFAQFIMSENSQGFTELAEVIVKDGIHVVFDYTVHNNVLLLKSYNQLDKYYREFSYEHTSKLSRVLEMNTTYVDGDISYAVYEYDTAGHISKINKNNATENYMYSVNLNGDLTVNVNKVFEGQLTVYEDIYNKYGQLTKYSYPGNTLTLQYDSTNRIITEIENDLKATIIYNEHGLPIVSDWSDGKTYNYAYSDSGEVVSKTVTCDGVTTQLPSDNISIITSADFSEDTTSTRATTISVEYNVDSNVCVLNWHKVYGLAQGSFNCYAYAIGRSHIGSVDPGNLSGIPTYGGSAVTLSKMKKYTEQDQENLGRDIYDSTVNATHNSHAWKIALKVRPGEDYHFMERSYNSPTLPSYWEFKCGRPGPVMRLRNNKTPSDVTWDGYGLTSNNIVVKLSTNYYNSAMHYMIIQD